MNIGRRRKVPSRPARETLTLRYAVISGEQYVEVEELVRLMRLNGELRAAKMLEDSARGEPVATWRVRA